MEMPQHAVQRKYLLQESKGHTAAMGHTSIKLQTNYEMAQSKVQDTFLAEDF